MPKTYRVSKEQLAKMKNLADDFTVKSAEAKAAHALLSAEAARALRAIGAPGDAIIEDDGSVTIPTREERLRARAHLASQNGTVR